MIKVAFLAIPCLALFAHLALADDVTTLDGKTYKNITVVKKDLYSITVLTDDGGATIQFTNLPPDLQKKYGYDPAAAQAKTQADEHAWAAQQAQNRALEEAKELKALEIRTEYNSLANQLKVSVLVRRFEDLHIREDPGIRGNYYTQHVVGEMRLDWINTGQIIQQPESTFLSFQTITSYAGTDLHFNLDGIDKDLPVVELEPPTDKNYIYRDGNPTNVCGISITRAGLDSLVSATNASFSLSAPDGTSKIPLFPSDKERLRVIMKYIDSLPATGVQNQ